VQRAQAQLVRQQLQQLQAARQVSKTVAAVGAVAWQKGHRA
jgi:hypothetical protein